MSKKSLFSLDYGLVIPACFLVILSLATLFSIDVSLFKNQLIFFIISLFFLIFFSQINYSFNKTHVLLIYLLSIILLTMVLFFGTEARGSVRWIEILGIRVQFSEIMKPFLAISLASFLSKSNNSSYKTFFTTLGALIPVVFLIFKQPDLGNAVVFGTVAILTLFVYGFPLRLFFLSFGFMFITWPILWSLFYHYQKERLISFFNPFDPLGLSYNAIQSVIAVGAGMIFGRGLGQGSQSELRFLPERHTDFIFATLAEGLGFVGVCVVILCFAILLYKIFKIFLLSKDSFSKSFSIVAFFLILTHFFLNIGMNIGVLPIVGITLPFVSYGGSSLVSSFIFLGILSAISRNSSNGNRGYGLV